MAHDFHCRYRVHTCPSEVGRDTVAQVEEPEIRYARVHEGGLEGPPDQLKRSPLYVKTCLVASSSSAWIILSAAHFVVQSHPRRIQLDQAVIIQHFAKLLMSTLHARFHTGN